MRERGAPDPRIRREWGWRERCLGPGVPRFDLLLLTLLATDVVVGCDPSRHRGFREERDEGAGGHEVAGGGACGDLARDPCIACCAQPQGAGACACGPICAPECSDACHGGFVSFDCVACVTDALEQGTCAPAADDDACARSCPADAGESSSGATTTAGAGSGGSSGDASEACVDRINQYRGTLGLPPYARWTRAERCADGQAESDSMSGEAHGAFTQCREWAQNECPGWPGTPGGVIGECLDAMWDEGPGGGHYENMSSSDYTEVACGFHVTPSGDVWAVQDFR